MSPRWRRYCRLACSYIAWVSAWVRVGDNEICREGCGSGQGGGNSPGEANESALKEAETDAMKRALTNRTAGPLSSVDEDHAGIARRFGFLGLYLLLNVISANQHLRWDTQFFI